MMRLLENVSNVKKRQKSDELKQQECSERVEDGSTFVSIVMDHKFISNQEMA